MELWEVLDDKGNLTGEIIDKYVFCNNLINFT